MDPCFPLTLVVLNISMLCATLADCSLNAEEVTTSNGCGELLYHMLSVWCNRNIFMVSPFLSMMQRLLQQSEGEGQRVRS